jgi:TetR/AcrR family fatty acid metabolism transcriptional regulator
MKEPDKREKILNAAEEVMSQKGLTESTISEIGRKAEVADSVIYQYFKGKEDLLFSIPGERMKEVLLLLNEQLKGILDATSRLSKMIWFHLSYNDMHPGYARILLLECRSSQDFYLTPAYKLIRQYSGILSDILTQGVKDGSFRPDLELHLIRDIILGLLDAETISCLVTGEVEESSSDLEDIMSLIYPMLIIKPDDELKKPERILLAAEKVFAKKGFTKAKISEIAKLAQVAEGTVYEYFTNKEDLLLSIPEKRFKKYATNLPEVFEIRSPLRKLRRFITHHFWLFLKERNFLQVFLFQIQLNKRFYGTKAFESYRTYFEFLEEIIEEGKLDGTFRADINTRILRNLFLGTFSHLGLRWILIGESTDADKMQEINKVTDLICAAVVA